MKWVCLSAILFLPAAVFAAEGAVSFAHSPLWLSSTHVTEGKTVQISTVVMKTDADSAYGTVAFFADGAQVGTTDFSLSNSIGGAVVALSWTPGPGKHAISAQIAKVTLSRNGKEESFSDLAETKSPDSLTVDADNDRDSIADVTDTDDDNDGVSDTDETKNGTDPLRKEAPKPSPEPQVAGASTSTANGFLEQVKTFAKKGGSGIFAQTESLRAKGGEYFVKKLREKENNNVEGFEAASTTEDGTIEKGKIPSWKSMLEGGLVDALKVGRYIFNNVYLFYIILILLTLWILRKIWRRFSLD